MANINLEQQTVKILNRTKKFVWPVIQSFLADPVYPKQFSIPKQYKSLYNYHWEMISDYPIRQGKYIRPTLVMLIAESIGVNPQTAKHVAATMQLSEEWILVSDDIEDDSKLRRGKMTLHKIHGTELAINASDSLHAIMWRSAFENKKYLSDAVFEKIYEEFINIILRTVLGQTFDLYWIKNNKKDYNENDWKFMADSKSGYYSIAGPIRLGGILGGVTESQLSILTDFGKSLGTAWQLIDDILDVTGDFGGRKEYANDIYEGKQTIMFAHMLKVLSTQNKNKLFKIYAKKRNQKTKNEVEWVIRTMQNSGSIEHARNLVEKYKQDAQKILATDLKFLNREPARSNLENLVNFIVEREY